ncbi:MAG: hypothetical protein WA947_20105, partial [Phormidesmis sp.]
PCATTKVGQPSDQPAGHPIQEQVVPVQTDQLVMVSEDTGQPGQQNRASFQSTSLPDSRAHPYDDEATYAGLPRYDPTGLSEQRRE